MQLLEKQLGHFNNPALLEEALTHRSYVNEHENVTLDNERLEFLGDAVLDFLVGEFLFLEFPTKPEGDLTTLRAALVKTDTLADFSRQWGVGAALALGAGEQENKGHNKSSTLCAAFEALIGALYLDRGMDAVRQVIMPLVQPQLALILEQSLHIDAKSEFQVWAQAELGLTPKYETVSAEGPDHAKVFTLHALLGDVVWGGGTGSSKQRAAQAAAASALQKTVLYKAQNTQAT